MLRNFKLFTLIALVIASAQPLVFTQAPTGQTHFEHLEANSLHYLPGEIVTVSGHGFSPSLDVLMVVHGPDDLQDLGTVRADESGNLSFSYQLGVVTGDYSVQAETLDGRISFATAQFSSGIYVVTDKPDYQPGETATFSGRGFEPGETVSLVVHHVYPGEQPDRSFSAVADDSGAFANSDFMLSDEDLHTTLSVTATGQTSGRSAQTAFSDAAKFVMLQKKPNNTTGTAVTSLTTTYNSSPTQNNLLVAVVGSFTSNTTSMTSAGWSEAINQAGAPTQAIFYKLAGAGETTSVIVGFSAATTATITIYEYSGVLAASGPFDGAGSSTGTGTVVSSGAVTPTPSSLADLLIAGFAVNSGATAAPAYSINTSSPLSPTNGFLVEASSATVLGGTTAASNRIASQSADRQNSISSNSTDMTIAASFPWRGQIAAFKAKTDTTTAVTTSGASVVGQTVTVTATVSATAGTGSGTALIGGTADIKDGVTTICSAAVVTSGVASCNVFFSTVASHSLTAVYSGDLSYNGSTSLSFAQSVTIASTSTTVVSNRNPSLFPDFVTFTATVAGNPPGSITPTGTVDFLDGVTTLCNNVALSGGQATCTPGTALTAGPHSITAHYDTSSQFSTSTSPALTQTVNVAGTCPLTVDSSGVATTAYVTIQGAINALPNPGPCTINIKAGTYNESVSIASPRNNSSATLESQRIVIQRDGSAAVGSVIVNATGANGFNFSGAPGANFITIKGLDLTGASSSAIATGTNTNTNLTFDSNQIYDNAPTDPSVAGGIDLSANTVVNIVIMNNLIRNNGRDGIGIGSTSVASIYIVNNTIFANHFNGIAHAGVTPTFLINNLIVGNGTAAGGTGGRFGLFQSSGATPANVRLINNIFYNNSGGEFSVPTSFLDSTDSGNRTSTGVNFTSGSITASFSSVTNKITKTVGTSFVTSGFAVGDTITTNNGSNLGPFTITAVSATEITVASGLTTVGSAAGVIVSDTTGVAGCTFTDCLSTHTFNEIFVDAGAANDFHLKTTAPISPAIDKGVNTYVSGSERVPAADFEGNSRPTDGDGAGGAQVDAGYDEANSATHTLSYAAGANGSLTGDSAQTVNHGADGTAVTAVPNLHYHFVDWSDGSTTNPRTDTNVTTNISVTANFAITTHTLSYAAGANGSLTGTTSQTVNDGSDGTAVTAVPDSGYHFVNWTPGGSTDNPRTDTNVTAAISVTANFAINTYAVNYAAGANGTLTGNPAQTVTHGTDGTAVTAVPDTGYHFVDWTPGGSTDNPRTDTNVTAAISVTANFAINTYAVNYAAGANGTLTGDPAQTVTHGTDGTAVTAVPDTGYHFVDWTPGGSTDNPRTDTNVTGAVSVTANFAINTYAVNYAAGANGSLTGDAAQTVTHGTDGTAVTAVPNTGYHFVDWTPGGSTDNPRTDTNVTGAISVTANFAINTYAVNYAAGANGSLTGDAAQTVTHGTDGTAVAAVPDAGYHFVDWTPGGSTDNPRTDTNVTAAISVTANFAINTYAVNYAAGANGSLTGDAAQTVTHGTDGTAVTAVPDTGYHFVDWTPGGSTDNPRTDTNVTGAISVTANFAINTYAANYAAGANGSLTGDVAQTVTHGTDGTAVTAVPDTGYHFVDWTPGGSTDNPRTDTNVTGAISVTANFAINTYAANYAAGANGSLTGDVAQTVTHGTDGTAVTAVPNTGYHFVDWTPGGSTDNPRTDTNVTGAISVTANFAINTYAVNYAAGANGTLTGDPAQTVTYGTDGTAVTAVPNTGYHFVNWTPGGSTDNPRTDTNVTGAISVTANFAINSYDVSYDGNTNTGGAAPAMQNAEYNSAVTLAGAGTLVKTGYSFAGWNTQADGLGTPYAGGGSFTIPAAATTFYAQWTINQYTVTFNNNGGSGSMSPQTRNYNDAANLTANTFTRTGYTFAGWNTLSGGGGTSYANQASYGFTASVTLYAQWTINQYTVTFNNNGGSGSMGAQTRNYNDAANLTANTFTRTGYTFTGWNTLAGGGGTSYANQASYPFTASATLYAQWTITQYTVTFNSNGGSGSMAAQTRNYNAAANLTANAFTRTGYTFAGWNTLAAGGGTSYANQASYPFTASVTLYAQWTINQYTVTFNSNGGSGSMAAQTRNYNAAANLTTNTFTRTGYTFLGWNTAANGSGTSYANGASYPFTASVTLYAQWSGKLVVTKVTSPVNDTTVGFGITASGTGAITGVATQTVKSGSPVTYVVGAGTYAVTEAATVGWVQTANTCSGIVVAPGATATCTITNTKAQSVVTALSGTASYVGQSGNSQIDIAENFTFPSIFNLATSTLTVNAVISELGGAGELLNGVGLTLMPAGGSNTDSATFVTPNGAATAYRFEVKQQDPQQKKWTAHLKIDGGVIAKYPKLCTTVGTNLVTTTLTTTFTVKPAGGGTPMVVAINTPWKCLDFVGGDLTKPASVRAPTP